MPRKLNFGCEIEMFTGRTPVPTALSMWRGAGLTSHDRLHAYHCHCEECVYNRPGGKLLAAQTDPSVGAEFITRILSNRSRDDMADLRLLKSVYADIQSATDFYPDGSQSCGNHVHVGWPSRMSMMDRGRVVSLLNGLFSAEIDLWRRTIATGGASHVRSYNSPSRLAGSYGQDFGAGYWSGSWVVNKGETVELRLWNTPRDPDRLLVHPALSVAAVLWALDVIEEEGDVTRFESARATSEWAQLRSKGSRKRIAKIVREVWLDRRSANHAAELIAA